MNESEIRDELRNAKQALEEMQITNAGSKSDRAALEKFINELSGELAEIRRQRRNYGNVLN